MALASLLPSNSRRCLPSSVRVLVLGSMANFSVFGLRKCSRKISGISAISNSPLPYLAICLGAVS